MSRPCWMDVMSALEGCDDALEDCRRALRVRDSRRVLRGLNDLDGEVQAALTWVLALEEGEER